MGDRDTSDALLAELIEKARVAKGRAYAPYSKFRVGAAIRTEDGKTFVGCNFENASYGACICAERNAVGAMIVAGAKRPIACAVVTEGETPASPCGICRQVLSEFARDMVIVSVSEAKAGDVRRDWTLAALLPEMFDLLGRS